MQTIDSFFATVTATLNSPKFENCAFPIYRGHSRGNFELLPTLHRDYKKTDFDIWTLENNLYCDFRSLVGPRINFRSSWETLFAMRHEGVPTRLLDWTENIGTALYFALNSKNVEQPHIWVLNPFELNESDGNAKGALVNPEEDLPPYSVTYAIYCDEPKPLHDLPLAIYPNRTNDRILAQRGLFTIHGLNESKMEDTCDSFIAKINIPDNLIEPLRILIRHFGINSYSVYPDFKGLCEYLKDIYRY